MTLRPSQLIATAAALSAAAAANAQLAINWYSIDAGGSINPSAAGPFTLAGTIGQPDAGALAGGTFACLGGFWAAAAGPGQCYANCDGSTGAPVLNVNDFICFQSRFAAANAYADCDQNAALNVNDFICFQARFAAGCP